MNRTHPLAVMSLLAAVGTALAGCGSNGNPATPAVALTQSPIAGGGTGLGGGARTPPGTFGVAAAVSASSLEVQNPQTGQTTVNFTAKTAFTRTAPAAKTAVTVGACVTAFSPGAVSGGTVTARSVEISTPVNGTCAQRRGFGGFGGRGGGFGGDGFGGGGFGQPGGPSSRPSGFPTTRPTGIPRFAGGTTVVGKVTALTNGGFTVDGFLRTGRRGFGSLPASPTATPALTTVTVTVDASTAFTRTVTATHTALKVGECIAALGPADDTGAVTARSIMISPSANGTCFSGFGRRFGAGGSNG